MHWRALGGRVTVLPGFVQFWLFLELKINKKKFYLSGSENRVDSLSKIGHEAVRVAKSWLKEQGNRIQYLL